MSSLLVLILAAQDAQQAVVDAAKKLADAGNYSFKGEVSMELPDMGGGGGGEPPAPQKFEGKHGEAGTTITTDTQEIVRIKDKTATRPRAEWRVIPAEGEGGEGRRGGGRRGLGGMMGGSRSMKAPHEDLAGVDKNLKDVQDAGKKETVGESECSLYTAKMTDEAARGMFGSGRSMGRMMEEAEFTGKASIWIDGEGRIAKYETTVTILAVMQGNEVEMSTTRTVMIYDVGTTKVEIPEGAKKAIESGEGY
jgi:hypothetical protein